MDLVMIDYGAGNVQSVQYALSRLGHKAELTDDPQRIERADKVIFPGVGAAKASMNALRKCGLDETIPKLTQPVLGICVGMQVLGAFSEEDNTACLGIIDARVRKIQLKKGIKVPHMGWNTIQRPETWIDSDLHNTYVYYVHSYAMEVGEWTVATTAYGGTFTAALKHKNFYGTQFHVEKSGGIGSRILSGFLSL